MEEHGNKKRIWIKLVMILLPFILGIGIGIAFGMSAGEKKAYQVMEQRQEAGASDTELTKVPEPTATKPLELTKVPVSGEAPEPTKVPVSGEAPKPTGVPVSGEAPELMGVPVSGEAPELMGVPVSGEAPEPTEKPVPTPAPVAEGKAGYYGPLHVEGTYLADAKGNLVQLRGISTHGIGWFPQYVNEAAIRQFHEEWGCNVFRLAMYTAEGAGYCTNDAAHKEKMKKLVDTGVKAAVAEGMYVIIDWHVLNDRDPHLYQDEAKKFFAEMAEKYADYPNVIYEICNEPNGGVSWGQIKEYAMEVIPIIRKYAPEAVIKLFLDFRRMLEGERVQTK